MACVEDLRLTQHGWKRGGQQKGWIHRAKFHRANDYTFEACLIGDGNAKIKARVAPTHRFLRKHMFNCLECLLYAKFGCQIGDIAFAFETSVPAELSIVT